MAFQRIWRRDHLNEQDALGAIREARARERQAQADLTDAVAAARTARVTWEAIGNAAGMARQSAAERWG